MTNVKLNPISLSALKIKKKQHNTDVETKALTKIIINFYFIFLQNDRAKENCKYLHTFLVLLSKVH
jgi:hypothetical protein